MDDAQSDLGDFRVNLRVDFDDKAKVEEIFRQLGFAAHYSSAQNDDQEALIQLLYQFKQNMTDALKTEITSKGSPAQLIDDITEYADELNEANITQETFKGSTKEVTAEAVAEFNEIYKQAIGICKIASRIFKSDALIKQKFSFRRIIGGMGS
jgi:hypothetical protein